MLIDDGDDVESDADMMLMLLQMLILMLSPMLKLLITLMLSDADDE